MVAATSPLVEIPLVFPALEDSPRVYIVNDQLKNARLSHTDISSSFYPETNERGAASVSPLQEDGSVLTTALLPSGVLGVSLLQKNYGPVVVHLDLRSEMSKFRSIIKVQAFSKANGTIHLVLVDDRSTILRLQLDTKTLNPCFLSIMNAAEQLAEDLDSQLATTPQLRTSMVVFVSPEILLLALHPFLMSIHLETTETAVWSKSKCLEDMRRTSLGSILSKGVDVFVGRLDHRQVLDMAAVSALCVAENDSSHVFSLHTDGVVRHWQLPVNKLEPTRLAESHVSQIPKHWNASDPYCLAMTARLYGSVWACAMHIRTHVSSPEIPDDMEGLVDDTEYSHTATSLQQRQQQDPNSLDMGSCSHLLVVDGLIDIIWNDTPTWHSIRLAVPPQTCSMVSMTFDPQSPKCALWTLQAPFDAAAAMHVYYPPSNLSMVSRKPLVLSDEFLLTAVSPNVSDTKQDNMADETTGSLQDRIRALDKYYMKQLFRSTNLPSRHTIRQALQQLVRYTAPPTTSIELETLQAVHTWRRRDERTSSPQHKRTAGTSIYDSVVVSTAVAAATTTTTTTEDGATPTTDEESQVQGHERRWKRLLQQILGEQQQQTPLCLSVLPTVAVVVRSASISVLQPTNYQPSTLDKAGANARQHTQRMERHIWNLISEGELEDTDGLLESIGRLSSTILDSLSVDESTALFEELDLPPHEWVDKLLRFENDPYTNGSLSWNGTTKVQLSCQQRLAAASLAVRSMQHLSQVLVGRLLLLAAVNGSSATKAVLRVYLHTVSSLWVAAQHVDMRYAKSGMVSVLAVRGVRNRTTAMDSLLIYLASQYDNSPCGDLSGETIRLARKAVESFICFRNSTRNGLPELAAIPPTTGGNLTSQPALALRLLAVHVEAPDERDDASIVAKRKNLFAECLLIASLSEKGEKGDAMVSRAIKLLPFDADDMPTSMKYVQMICHHLKGRSKHQDVLIRFIMNAIESTPANNVTDMAKLWSTLFDTSIAVSNWVTAFEAAVSSPDKERRLDSLKRFVRAMVDAGALSELLGMCSSLDSVVEKVDHLKALVNNSELYAIAASTLAENSGRDLYSLLAVDPEPLSDYQGALYALYASQSQWKLAAEALQARAVHGKNALVNKSSYLELPPDAAERREVLIVDDIVLSSIGCVLALKQVSGAAADFLAPGVGLLSSPLLSRPGTNALAADTVGSNRLAASHFKTKEELATEAVVCMSLKTLFSDRLLMGRAFAMAALSEETISAESMVQCIDLLFAGGFYHGGLMVANARSKLLANRPEGLDVFAEALGHMLCTYLVPLSSGELIAKNRPTLPQISSALDTTSFERGSFPSILALRSGSNIPSLYAGAVRAGAGALAHAVTCKYTSAATPLGVEVAECLLESDVNGIPSWLENLLAHSATGKGLFARRSSAESSSYLGDPSALLTLYTKRGLYGEACRLVCAVLRGNTDRKTEAPLRLPEKGDMDYVPYQKIDLLWNLIEDAVQSQMLSDEMEREVVASRQDMEMALESHLELLGISEMGLQSARALRR